MANPTLPYPNDSTGGGTTAWLDLWPIGLGLLVLYVPTYVRLATDYWNQPEYAHGPIVLLMSLWLAWRGREALLGARPARRSTTAGGSILAAGLVCYALGRSQDIPLLEVASQIPVAAGALLLARGYAALRSLWFAFFFLLFLVPLPGIVVDPLTGQLKHVVSAVAELVLHHAGYPVARSGVVLNVAQYQLLVADACSGLHSLFSMAAIGVFYIHLTGTGNRLRDGLLVACLLPIGFAANVVRVLLLVLVTFHFGDAAGQGFVHDFSGLLVFAIGMLLLFAFDSALVRLLPRPAARRP